MSEQDRNEGVLEGATVEERDAAKLDQQRQELADYTLERQGVNSTIATKDVEVRTPGHIVGALKRPMAALDGAVKVVDAHEVDQVSAPNIVIQGDPQEKGFVVNLVELRRSLKHPVKRAA